MRWRRTKVTQRRVRSFEILEQRAMLAAQPIISEFMASNDATIQDGFGNDSDWIELYNAGDAAIDLQGYHLTDSLNNLTKWTFPASTVLNPNQYLIVFASDLNTIDPLGYYHTNYKLSAEGEDIALVAPNLTILSQIGPNGDDYPPQLTDISYGLGGPVLVNGSSPAAYLIPTNDSLGLTWTEVDFNAGANGFSNGTASVGYDVVPSPVNFAGNFQTTVPNGTTSVYIRTEFNLDSAAAVSSLNLNLKYDDGVVVYLNGMKVASAFAPASPVYNSLATGTRADAVSLIGVDFPLTPFLGSLRSGKNVLAIHLLNQNSTSVDLLVDPVLSAVMATGTLGYLATPTPGSANSSLINVGPIIRDVAISPDNPTDNETITVSARITPYVVPLNSSSVKLHYRVMYGGEVEVIMVDNGTAGDLVAGDGVFSAQIPEIAFTAGQMVRWYVTAADTSGTTSRAAPQFQDPLDSPEYYGTVIVDPGVNTELPVFYWFVQNPNAAATETGTRASLYLYGEFYDNIEVDLHGQSTTQPQFTKKSFNFDANNGLKFEVDPSFGRVSDFNLITNLTDKTYLRNTLGYELFTEAGGPGHYAFSAVVYRNGSYYGLYDVVEDGDEEFLERVGLDPDGALYKMTNALVSSTNLVEKKSRNYENNSDLQQVVSTSSLNALQGETWIYDNLDVAEWANYFAVQTLIGNRDFGDKNYYLYRDSNDTGLWTIIPWDVDLSFGHQWNPAENYFDDDLIFNDGFYVNQGNNHLMNRLKSIGKFNEMYSRRLRTLLDEFYGPPGGSIEDSHVADRFDELIGEIGVEALFDRNTWGTAAGMAYETPTQAIARVKQDFLAARKQFLQTLPGLPISQVANPSLTFGAIDFNPTSGNQAQEYFAIGNGSSAAVDISGWTISGAVSHEFEGGTVIPANSTLYVVADVAQFKLRTTGPSGGQRLLLQGNFTGQLDNTFGQLSLKNKSGATVTGTSYGVQPVLLPGDYDLSGTVDDLDYALWKNTFGSTSDLRADGNGSLRVDAADYVVWRNHLGTSNGAGSSGAASAVDTALASLGNASTAAAAVPVQRGDLRLPAASSAAIDRPATMRHAARTRAAFVDVSHARNADLLATLFEQPTGRLRGTAEFCLPAASESDAIDSAIEGFDGVQLATF